VIISNDYSLPTKNIFSMQSVFAFLDSCEYGWGKAAAQSSVVATRGDVRPMTAGRDQGRDSTRRLTPGGINSDGLHSSEVSRSQEFPCEVPDRAIGERS
jgi:hypothetical protein